MATMSKKVDFLREMCRYKAMKLNKACTIFLMGFQPPSIDKYG